MIVGCDYSTKAVDLAYHDPPMWWEHVRLPVNGIDDEFLRQLTVTLRRFKKRGGKPVIYVEQPWMRNNAKTSMLMMKVATVVKIVAQQQGYRAVDAHVVAWRSAVFGKAQYDKAEAKARALAWAIVNTGLEIKDDNAADACCIAQYGLLKERGDGPETGA